MRHVSKVERGSLLWALGVMAAAADNQPVSEPDAELALRIMYEAEGPEKLYERLRKRMTQLKAEAFLTRVEELLDAEYAKEEAQTA